MATIRKVKRKRGHAWEAQVRLAGARQRTHTFATEKAAIAWARDEEGEADQERVSTDGLHTLADAVRRYKLTAFRELLPETQRGYLPILKWWHDTHGGTPLAEINAAVLSKIRDELRGGVLFTDSDKPRQRGAGTVNRYMSVLSGILDLAWREWEWTRENPVKRLKKIQEPPGRAPMMSTAQIAALLAVCGSNLDLRAYIAIPLSTGMRQGEVLRLRWADVDLDRRVIVLHHTKNRERRGVPISDELAAELERLPRRGDLLFPMQADVSRISRDTRRWAFRRAAREAGVPHLRYHDLRHVAASYLAMGGASPLEIAEVLGHKTLAMVKRYAHLSPTHVVSVVQRLGKQVLPPIPPASEPADGSSDT